MGEDKKEQSVGEQGSKSKGELKATLLGSVEGRLLLTGVAMAFVFTLWLGVSMLLSPKESQVLVGMTATHIMFGRAAGMAFGYSLDLEHRTVIPICMILETIMVLILYPLFVFSWQHLLEIKWLKNIADRTRKAAEQNKDIVRKYGIAGLFVFVWFPFWMTGPVIGCVIGYLLGLKTWVNMTVVLSGSAIAIVGWAVFLRQFHERVAPYGSYATMVLLLFLIILVIMGHLLHRRFRENRDKE